MTITAQAVDETEKAAPTARKISYYKDIRPIFQTHCQGCHQPAKKGGDYVMTDFPLLLKGGESEETAVVANKPDESYLISLISKTDGVAEMPQNKNPLADSEVDLIRKWITQGAENDSPVSTRLHYSPENPPVYVAAPIITSVDFSNDGKYLAISGFHEVLLYRADGSELVARLINSGVKRKSGKFATTVIHLGHPLLDRTKQPHNFANLMQTLTKRKTQANTEFKIQNKIQDKINNKVNNEVKREIKYGIKETILP